MNYIFIIFHKNIIQYNNNNQRVIIINGTSDCFLYFSPQFSRFDLYAVKLFDTSFFGGKKQKEKKRKLIKILKIEGNEIFLTGETNSVARTPPITQIIPRKSENTSAGCIRQRVIVCAPNNGYYLTYGHVESSYTLIGHRQCNLICLHFADTRSVQRKCFHTTCPRTGPTTTWLAA